MGVLKINGVDILNYTTPVAISEVGTAHSAFGTKIKGLTSEVTIGTKKVVTGWQLSDANHFSTNADYDAASGKIKVNGTAVKVMYDGTRPRNLADKVSVTGTGLTRYLNNVNGSLYLSTAANSASGTFITASKAPNKDCVVNIAAWGSGGKGGGGAYFFLAGNYGGIGGAGGAKVFFTACILNNTNLRIVTDSDSSKRGRTTHSRTAANASPSLYVYSSNSTGAIITCEGGNSGFDVNRREGTDGMGGGGTLTVDGGTALPIIIRKSASGAAKRSNGLTGNSVTFSNNNLPCLGNPEENKGTLDLTGSGGMGPQTSVTYSQGSGGGGSYGNGGRAGDTGSGSPGSAGANGGGGGGAGSPAGGANGGDGGYPGFIVFY